MTQFLKIANKIEKIAKEIEAALEKNAAHDTHDHGHGVPQKEQNQKAHDQLEKTNEDAVTTDEGKKVWHKFTEPADQEVTGKFPKEAAEKDPHNWMHGVPQKDQNIMFAKELDDLIAKYEEVAKREAKVYKDQSENSTYYGLGKKAAVNNAVLEEAVNLLKIAKWLHQRGL